MSRLLKGLVCVAVALALAGAPMVASAAPVREHGVVSLLEAAWARVVAVWTGVVGAEKARGTIVPASNPECLGSDCGTPKEVDAGPGIDSDG